MRSPGPEKQFQKPGLFAVKAQELPLSGQALMDLTRAVIARGRPIRFRARGWSMAPFIQDGDVITVSPLSEAGPNVGEVVAFVRPADFHMVVHRVVARHGMSMLIQGDNGIDETDGLIQSENLLGRVTQIERNGRPVRLGLGPERFVIAWLSRTRLLVPLQLRLSTWRRRFS